MSKIGNETHQLILDRQILKAMQDVSVDRDLVILFLHRRFLCTRAIGRSLPPSGAFRRQPSAWSGVCSQSAPSLTACIFENSFLFIIFKLFFN